MKDCHNDKESQTHVIASGDMENCRRDMPWKMS